MLIKQELNNDKVRVEPLKLKKFEWDITIKGEKRRKTILKWREEGRVLQQSTRVFQYIKETSEGVKGEEVVLHNYVLYH